MDQCLGNIKFRLVKPDLCAYMNENEVGLVMMTLYIDNLLLIGTNKLLLNKLKKQLIDRFEVTDMGDVSRVLETMSSVIAKRAWSPLIKRTKRRT